MKIIIGGDLVPTSSNMKYFVESDVTTLLGDQLLNKWRAADFRIFNLEVPLTDKFNPISKCGPNLIAPLDSINGIKALKPSLITLANNHILDQGYNGLRSTIDILKNNEISFIGAGLNNKEASKSHIFYKDEQKVGIYNCAEHEFNIATESSPGANPFDVFESLDHIQHLKSICNYVIVLYHGGKEHYRYPTPLLQKKCRKMVEKGADLVVCQHSHCIGSFEKHLTGTIIYGQGNFIFDKSSSEYWRTSILVEVQIRDSLQLSYIPIVKLEGRIALASYQEGKEILDAYYQRSKQIQEEGFIEKRLSSFSEELFYSYATSFSGMNKWISRLDRYVLKGAIIKHLFKSEQKKINLRNFIECESHHEVLLAYLKGATVSERE